MATIRKRGNRWQVLIRRKGTSPLTKTFSLFGDAKEWARHQERLADSGELGPDRKELDRIILAQLVQRYINETLPAKKGAEIERIVLEALLRDKICKKRLSELTRLEWPNGNAENRPCTQATLWPIPLVSVQFIGDDRLLHRMRPVSTMSVEQRPMTVGAAP